MKTGPSCAWKGGATGPSPETAGLALSSPRARLAATASRDDVFEDISQADSRNGNRERDEFHATQGVARLTLMPTARLTLTSSVLYKHSHADIDSPGLLPTGEIGLVDDVGAFGREETWVAQTTAQWRLRPGFESSLRVGFTRNRVSVRSFDMPAGFDQRLLFACWVNTQTLYRGAADQSHPLASPKLDLCWGAEAQQEEGANQFDLPGLRLRDAAPWPPVFSSCGAVLVPGWGSWARPSITTMTSALTRHSTGGLATG